MRLFDPARPQSDGIALGQWDPAAHGHSGTFAIPTLYVDAGSAPGQWLITAHMPTSANGFSGFQTRAGSTAELLALFERFELDVERTLLEDFKYDPSSVKRKVAGRAIVRERTVAAGLAALGLGDDE